MEQNQKDALKALLLECLKTPANFPEMEKKQKEIKALAEQCAEAFGEELKG